MRRRISRGRSLAAHPGFPLPSPTLSVELSGTELWYAVEQQTATVYLIYLLMMILCYPIHCTLAAVSDCYYLDPSDSSWKSRASLPSARTKAASAVLSDGRFWVIGGQDSNRNDLSSTVIYDPDTDSWENGPTLLSAAFYMCAVNYNDTHVFFSGGTQSSGDLTTGPRAYLYNWVDNFLVRLSDFSTPRFDHACAVVDGDIVVVGTRHEYTGLSEIYSVMDDTWSSGPDLGLSVGGGKMLKVGDKTVYAAGSLPSGYSDEVYEYSPSGWTRLENLGNGGREHFVAMALSEGQLCP